MLRFTLFSAVFAIAGCGVSESKVDDSNTFKDSRDQKAYTLTTDAGGRVWFASDLNHLESATVKHSANGVEMAMYNWNDAMNACPEGWRLPTRADFRNMLDQFPDSDDEGADNAAEAFVGLYESDTTRFNLFGMYVANPDGIGSPINKGAGEFGYYWTSTVGDNNKAYALRFDSSRKVAYLQTYDKRGIANCLCIKNELQMQQP
ncbi:MAG: FISUMP domain-containing protein [Flavobacteriales bacterium]|jgi:uncharacterized protein (TIGR02145 family)